MAERGYLDFDLVIERAGEGFRARVVNSPGGQATTEFQRPFLDMEVENFVLRMGRKRGGIRRINSPEMESAKKFGGQLFDRVFSTDVRDCLRTSLERARDKQMGLRIRLRLAEAPELADLPWEYLYNSNQNRFLALSNETPLVRYLDVGESARPLAVKPPIKVLAMVSSPTNLPELNVEEEKAKLKKALRDLEKRARVEIDFLEDATLGTLQQRLRDNEYHVFHFIGHGGFDKQTEEGLLVFEEEDKTGKQVPAQFLGALLYDERTLRLAILNACEGARTSRCDPFSGTAQSLVQQGIPAVIAMQFDVSDEAAIAFTYEFYRAIASGYPVDAALAEGRKAIYAQVNEVEWGTPVLYMRSPDGNIFDVEDVKQEDFDAARITGLVREGEQELIAENWSKAIEKFLEAFELSAQDPKVGAKLDHAKRQQEMARLYAEGRTAYDAGRGAEALGYFHKLQSMKPDYKGVEPLIRTIEKELARSREKEEQRAQVGGLSSEADNAMAAENWRAAIEKLEALLAIDRSNSVASAKLAHARKQQELADLYHSARTHFEAGRMRESLSDLRRIERIDRHYKDLAARIAAVSQQVAREDAARSTHLFQPPPSEGGFFSRFKLLGVGGCIGAAIVVALVIAFFVYVLSNYTPPQTTEPASTYPTSEPTSQPQPTMAPQSEYATKCVTPQTECLMQVELLVGAHCTCTNLQTGEVFYGIAR